METLVTKRKKNQILLNQSEPNYAVNDAFIDYGESEDNSWYKYVEQLHIAPGISLCIVDKPAGSKIVTRYKVEKSPLELAFCLKGSVASELKKEGYDTQSFQMVNNDCSISYVPHCNGSTVIENDGSYQAVSICVDITVLHVLFERHLENLSMDVMTILSGKNAKPIYQIIKTPSVMHAAVFRIFNCSFSEPMRKLYITSKVYELISLMLTEFMLERKSSSKSILQPSDINQTIIAGNLLKNNLDNPPSVSELARSVYLSETKLKRGFKEMYGTTIYGYLHLERMEKAKTVLDSGSGSVNQVAFEVGYVNVSHFISAFRKHFGVNPGKYLSDIKQGLVRNYLPTTPA